MSDCKSGLLTLLLLKGKEAIDEEKKAREKVAKVDESDLLICPTLKEFDLIDPKLEEKEAADGEKKPTEKEAEEEMTSSDESEDEKEAEEKEEEMISSESEDKKEAEEEEETESSSDEEADKKKPREKEAKEEKMPSAEPDDELNALLDKLCYEQKRWRRSYNYEPDDDVISCCCGSRPKTFRIERPITTLAHKKRRKYDLEKKKMEMEGDKFREH